MSSFALAFLSKSHNPLSSPKKPKSKKQNTEAGPSSQHPRISLEGTKESPIALMDDEDDSSHIYNHQSLENGHAKAGGDRKKKNLHAAGATHSRSPSAAQYGTGLNAPLTGNLAVMRKLNWIDPDPNHGHADGDNEGYGDGGEKVGMKRKRVSYTTVVENGKKRKIVDIVCFPLCCSSSALIVIWPGIVRSRAAGKSSATQRSYRCRKLGSKGKIPSFN